MADWNRIDDAANAEIKRRWNKESASKIAELLGLKRSTIYKAAKRLGLPKAEIKLPLSESVKRHGEAVRILNQDGYCDKEIAGLLKVSCMTIHAVRQHLELPAHIFPKWMDENVILERALKNGKTTAEKIRESSAQYAKRSGWPVDLKPREITVLNLLASTGLPTKKKDIMIALRITYPTVHNAIASLCKRGLVVHVPLERWQERGYFLSQVALSILEERAREEDQNSRRQSDT